MSQRGPWDPEPRRQPILGLAVAIIGSLLLWWAIAGCVSWLTGHPV